MNAAANTTVVVFLPTYHEYATFNTRDIATDHNGRRTVIACGQITGRPYKVILDDDNRVISDWHN